jgi:isopentenyldiphosphate isomerase
VKRFPYFQEDPNAYRSFMRNFYYLKICDVEEPIGYIHKSFVAQMKWAKSWSVDESTSSLTLNGGSTVEERSHIIQKTLQSGEQEGLVENHKIWGEALFPIYAKDGYHVFNIDLCGLDIFGVICQGVHLTAFVRTVNGPRYWVQRRGRDKLPFPGMLDNTVASNLLVGEKPLEKLIRKAGTEASIPASYLIEHVIPCGTVTYQMATTAAGAPGCQRHVQHVYELELPDNFRPRSSDGEVEGFELMTISEIGDALMNGEFASWRVMTWIAHFKRRGIISATEDLSTIDISARLHRKLDAFVV